MHELTVVPEGKELRKFGIVGAVILSGLFGLLVPLLFQNTWPLWPWVVSVVLILWAVVHPTSLILIYRPWMKFGYIMGRLNSFVILSIMFYVIITPMGLLIRLFGKELIAPLDISSESYRIKASKRDKQHMEHPY